MTSCICMGGGGGGGVGVLAGNLRKVRCERERINTFMATYFFVC